MFFLDNWLELKHNDSKALEVASDKKAFACVNDSLYGILFKRYNQTCSKDLWDKIKGDFQKLHSQLLFVLRSKFFSCKKCGN